jgi:pimeloyl-ACP methyl ester carboxylesterase
VVSFDVRGSHRSRPVGCTVEPLGELPTGEDAQIAALDAFSQRFAETCVAQNDPFIRSMSFNTIARDMELLRRALGERQISYVGLSFGTTLGALLPERVLDGLAGGTRDAQPDRELGGGSHLGVGPTDRADHNLRS